MCREALSGNITHPLTQTVTGRVVSPSQSHLSPIRRKRVLGFLRGLMDAAEMRPEVVNRKEGGGASKKDF